jgi:hypothetical protein
MVSTENVAASKTALFVNLFLGYAKQAMAVLCCATSSSQTGK